ncbi:MAG: hypothetical protein H5T35_06350, partial [Methanothermobacter sp.]|nr:hypothetical protein [Methanothermobacter sp.]
LTVMGGSGDWSFAPAHLNEKVALGDGCTYYLCDGSKCHPPAEDPERVMEYLGVK